MTTSIQAPTAPNIPRGEKLAPSRFSSASEKELFQTAQKWVGQTFFGTLLKQMHDSPFKSEVFSGGRGGEAFSTLYDQHLAERMARSSGRPLANAIVKHIQRTKTAKT